MVRTGELFEVTACEAVLTAEAFRRLAVVALPKPTQTRTIHINNQASFLPVKCRQRIPKSIYQLPSGCYRR